MPVSEMTPDDRPAVLAMMQRLWPEAGDYDFDDERVFVWRRPEGGLGGFASVSLRPWAEGCSSTPCPYVEGWWVDPDLRKQSIGRALFAAIESWCREHGFTELASDARVDNLDSQAAHTALGFEPTERLQFFRKPLG